MENTQAKTKRLTKCAMKNDRFQLIHKGLTPTRDKNNPFGMALPPTAERMVAHNRRTKTCIEQFHGKCIKHNR